MSSKLKVKSEKLRLAEDVPNGVVFSALNALNAFNAINAINAFNAFNALQAGGVVIGVGHDR